MNEREFRWELVTQGRAVGGGRLLEGERIVLGPTGSRKDSGFVAVPWHVRLTVAGGRLLVASVAPDAPAFVGGSNVPTAFVELETPSVVVAGNVEVRVSAVRASSTVVTRAKVKQDETIAARASEPSLTMLAGSGEHRVPPSPSRTSLSPVRPVSRAAPVPAPPLDADASMMTRHAPLPTPKARPAHDDLRETRTLSPIASPPSPWPPMPMTIARPAPALVGVSAVGPATERTPTMGPAKPSGPYAYTSGAYAPAPPPVFAASERPSPPPVPATRRPRAAVLALGAAGLFAALALMFAGHRAASTRASAPRPTATARAGLAATATAGASAEAPKAAAPAKEAKDAKDALPTEGPKPSVAPRSPGRDPAAERRIAKALLAGDTPAATTETDALLAVHPEIVEYRTMRRALRRMAPPGVTE